MPAMRRRSGKLLAILCGSTLALAACGGTGGSGTTPKSSGPAQPKAVTITHTTEQEFASYNRNTADANALKNSLVLQRVLTGFWYFGADGELKTNTDFGTYKKTSDSPLTVDYTISDKAVWSDGSPIDCDDILLYWAASAGKYGFSTSGGEGINHVKVPECKAGDKTFSFVYDEPFADWASVGPGATAMLPAQVVEKQGGLSEADLIAAIKAGDKAKLAKAAKFYNEGWVMTGKLLSEDLIPSSGPYKLSKWDKGQSITLVPNDKYWGAPPASKTIVIRFIAQDEQVQALQNQEVNIIEPQPNPDLLKQIEGVQGVKSEVGSQFTYDHLDFNLVKGPMKDKRVREAFAKCVPRKLIVDNLIKPIQPDAEPMDVRNVAPFLPYYKDVVSQSGGASKYATTDIAGAKALLAQAGQPNPTVNIGYIVPNPRRTQVVELITAECGKAGFKIVDKGEENFFDPDGGLANQTFDVALFGWAGSSLVSGWASTFRSPKACTPTEKGNNNGCYSNKKVDDLITQINKTIDKDAQIPLIAQVEKALWDDLVTIPLYSQPQLTAWTDTLKNIEPNPSQATISWNMDKWSAQ